MSAKQAMAGLEGVQRALSKRNMALVASGTFKRNTTAVKSALLNIMKGHPEAVVTIGPYKPVAEFIKLAHQVKLDAIFVSHLFRRIGIAGKGTRRPRQSA